MEVKFWLRIIVKCLTKHKDARSHNPSDTRLQELAFLVKAQYLDFDDLWYTVGVMMNCIQRTMITICQQWRLVKSVIINNNIWLWFWSLVIWRDIHRKKVCSHFWHFYFSQNKKFNDIFPCIIHMLLMKGFFWGILLSTMFENLVGS